ncbi:MAG: TIGR03943 family protein [Firmicutes bacterium]|nr:TIGR03943 family protein [Bacillota bacterium]
MKNLKNHFVTIVLASYIIFLGYLLSTGNLRKYINPRLSFLSVLTVIMLAGMLVFHLREPAQNVPAPGKHKVPGNKLRHNAHIVHDKSREHSEHHCICGQQPEEPLGKRSMILLLPILLTLLIAPETLSYQPGDNPGVNDRAGVSSKQSALIEPLRQESPGPEYTEYTQLDIGNVIFDTYQPAKDKLVTTKIFLQGEVYHPKEFKPNEVVLYRMAISCCIADALPLGVLVKLPENSRFKDGDWIGVEGTIKLLPYEHQFNNIEPLVNMVPLDKVYPYFTATRAYRMKTPRNTYMY